MIFFAILFSPFFIIYILICFCCNIKWYEKKYISKMNTSNSSNSKETDKNDINIVNYNNIRSPSEIITFKDPKKENNSEYEEEKEKDKKHIYSIFREITPPMGIFFLKRGAYFL